MSDPSLKCVLVSSPRRNLCTLVLDRLTHRVPAGELRRMGDEAYVVHTEATTADIRDWLNDVLREDERALVLEFETWSGLGPVDSEWLMRRGH